MVNRTSIKTSNSQITQSSVPRVAVFVGGTAGIGKLTLGGLARLGLDFKAYVIGRKESEVSFRPFTEDLQAANPKASIIWVEGEVSLLSEAKRVCDHIKTLETSIDLLFMTPGFAPFNGRKNTSEGLDIAHALSFYTRMCFLDNLLPQLRASGRARVISVGGAGIETARWLNIDDLNLEKPGAYGAMASQTHMAMMSTLTLERYAEMPENESITFIHNNPGIVRTGNLYRGFDEGSWGSWAAAIFMDPILMIVAYTFEESTERHVYQVTSGTFGGEGPRVPGVTGITTRGKESGGLFLVSGKCDSVRNEWQLTKLRERGADVVAAKVKEIIGPYT